MTVFFKCKIKGFTEKTSKAGKKYAMLSGTDTTTNEHIYLWYDLQGGAIPEFKPDTEYTAQAEYIPKFKALKVVAFK